MKVEVVGVQRKTGTFKDRDTGNEVSYDVVVLHGLYKTLAVSGNTVEQFKIKPAEVGKLVAAVGGKLENLVGHVYDIEANGYRKITSMELVK